MLQDQWGTWMPAEMRQENRRENYLPKFSSDVINLLLMLEHLLTVSLKQQGGHTQVVGVEPFKLRIKEEDSFFLPQKSTEARHLVILSSDKFYLGDVKFLQPIQEGCEN